MSANKNKKGQSLEGEGINSLVLWIIFLIIAGGAIAYFIVRKLTG